MSILADYRSGSSVSTLRSCDVEAPDLYVSIPGWHCGGITLRSQREANHIEHDLFQNLGYADVN